jgi:Ser/Thr protein kinase RdoA (MazF antagonist)
LLGKLLPLQHAGEIGGTLHVVERTVDAPPAETREEWLARRTKELGVSLTASARPN